MTDLAFAESSTTFLPRHRQSTLAIAALIHIAVFALLIVVKTPPVRVHALGSSSARIAAYVAPARRARRRAAAPRTTAPATTAATEIPTPKEAPQEDRAETPSAAGSTGAPGSTDATVSTDATGSPAAAESTDAVSAQSAGPVRLRGGALTLLKKVSPAYPSVMQSARVSGVVVLDAIIHSDGTIGDITVLRSTNDLFARAAIAAVKKWRYTPLPYEGIVTVTVNFTLT